MALLERPGEVVTRQELRQPLWSEDRDIYLRADPRFDDLLRRMNFAGSVTLFESAACASA